jgi:hypothetical protein
MQFLYTGCFGGTCYHHCHFLPRRWRQQVTPKYWCVSTETHGITSQKTVALIFTTMITSKLQQILSHQSGNKKNVIIYTHTQCVLRQYDILGWLCKIISGVVPSLHLQNILHKRKVNIKSQFPHYLEI